MRKGNNIFINLIFFIFGCIITYISLQFSYFELNTEINIVETFISLLIALIGFYIAISIQKKSNRDQSLYSIVKNKMDNVWDVFSLFDNRLNTQNTIKLEIATKALKSLYKELNNLKIIFKTFKIDDKCIVVLEENIDKLDILITSECPISSNVVTLSSHRDYIKDESDSIHQNIVNALKEINGIL